MPRDHALYAFLLTLVSLIGVIVLSLTHVPIPPILSEMVLGTTIGGAALSKGSK